MKSNATQAMVAVVTLPTDKANPILVNLVTRFWRVIHASQLLAHFFPEYLKLVEIAMIHVLGSIEDESSFSSVSFLKNKLRNCLNPHLELVAMYSQKFFTLENFPYQASYDLWTNVGSSHGQG
jgi:hypothetical protein